MEEKKELGETQKVVKGEGEPQVPALSEAEIAELKNKAEVSSQNFERAKKAEARMKELEQQLSETKTFSDEDYSDEGKALRSEILTLREDVIAFKKQKEEETIYNKFPQLKDKESEFKEYLESPELKGLSLERSAKLFMAENDLAFKAPARVGLEKPTAGEKGKVKKGWTQEEVRSLRETQPRKYEQMLRDGRLNPDEIQD